MALDTEIYTIDDLIEFYSDTPENVYHYKIYCTDPAKDIVFGVGSTDDELYKDLQRIFKNKQNRNKYFLVLFTDDSFKKSSIYKSVSFQLNKKQSISGIESELNELRNLSNDDDDDDIDDEKESGIVGYIKQMFPPQVMQQLILQFASNFMQPKNNNQMQSQPQGIGNIPDETNIESINILNSLISKGVTIEHLRKLDAIDVNKLHTLLMML